MTPLAHRVVLASLLFLLPGTASAVNIIQTFDFSGASIVGEDPGFAPDVTIRFSYDNACTVDCGLEIKLTYNDSGGLSTIGQALAGVNFDLVGTAIFDTADPGNSVIASALVGAGSTAGDVNVDVTPQWAFGDVTVAGWGQYSLSSVGDQNFGEDTLGTGDRLPGTPSSLEPNSPDGTPYSIVDPNTCQPGTCGSLQGGFKDSTNNPRVWIQNMATATLIYDGELLSIENVRPFFGTDGAPTNGGNGQVVPEPGSVALFAVTALLTGGAVRRGRRWGKAR